MSIHIPANLLPSDGRFGSGPSKVRREQLVPLTGPTSIMGTSHRKAAVKDTVKRIQDGLRELFALPDEYEVVLGNGGATAVWDAIPLTLVDKVAQCAVVGEFSAKAAKAVSKAPWLSDADIRSVEYGGIIECEPSGADSYLYAHNETSTGALTPLRRVEEPGSLTIVDGTSIAGAIEINPQVVDFYYFSPQKAFASDGGLWLALVSPDALARIDRLASSRWVPDFLNLQLAINNSRKNQTLNTPALATLTMLDEQVSWMLAEGGLAAMARRSAEASALVYSWATDRDFAVPFIRDEKYRSPVVATIDIDESIDATAIAATLRDNGIVDIEPYRSLGRNQFRIATFPAVTTADVEALLACIDYVVERA